MNDEHLPTTTNYFFLWVNTSIFNCLHETISHNLLCILHNTVSFIVLHCPSSSTIISGMLLSLAFFAAVLLPNHGVNGVNVALEKPATQLGEGYYGLASRAVDGNTSGDWYDNSVTCTSKDNDPWWEVDLEETYVISSIVVYNRQDCCDARLNDFSVTINSVPEWTYTHTGIPDYQTIIPVPNKFGSKVKVSIPGIEYLSLAEVEVYEKEQTCRPGRLALDTMVTTKDYGKYIVASLKRRMKTGTWSRSAFNRKVFEDNKTETIRRCIDTEKCYKLKLGMKDKGTESDEMGDYKFFLDGALYEESPFEKGKRDVHFIGTCI